MKQILLNNEDIKLSSGPIFVMNVRSRFIGILATRGDGSVAFFNGERAETYYKSKSTAIRTMQENFDYSFYQDNGFGLSKIDIPELCEKSVDALDVDPYSPIFAKDGDKLVGMLVEEDEGWIIRVGGRGGATGFHVTLKEAMEDAYEKVGYTFFVEE